MVGERETMEKSTIERKIFVAFNTALLLLFSIICLYPILYVTFGSLSDANMLMEYSGFLWKPLKPTLAAYRAVAKNKMVLYGYANTLFVVGIATTINIIMTTIGAYILSRKNVMLKKAIMIYIMITMYFSGGLIPCYLNIRNLGLYDSLWSLILLVAINTYNLIIMKTSFDAVPDSLTEAATIDGAGHAVIMFRVILPLAKATVAVMVLYYGVAHWNSWFTAAMYIQDRYKYPLQLVLREILIQNDTSAMMQGGSVNDTSNIAETIKYAVIVVSTLPILCIYPLLQKYFAKGALVGAVKG